MHNFSTDQPNRHQRYIVIGIATAVIYLGGISVFGPVLGLSMGVVSSALYFSFTGTVQFNTSSAGVRWVSA